MRSLRTRQESSGLPRPRPNHADPRGFRRPAPKSPPSGPTDGGPDCQRAEVEVHMYTIPGGPLSSPKSPRRWGRPGRVGPCGPAPPVRGRPGRESHVGSRSLPARKGPDERRNGRLVDNGHGVSPTDAGPEGSGIDGLTNGRVRASTRSTGKGVRASTHPTWCGNPATSCRQRRAPRAGSVFRRARRLPIRGLLAWAGRRG